MDRIDIEQVASCTGASDCDSCPKIPLIIRSRNWSELCGQLPDCSVCSCCQQQSMLLEQTTYRAPLVMSAAQNPVLERGRAIYESHCISCHGANGSGTTEVPAPIFGDRPTSDLADLVTRTMPEGSPEDCVGDDARAVAEWMQQQFYSPEAQARLNPPRIEFSRLTVSQYRNAIADLGTSFRWKVRARRGTRPEGRLFCQP